MRLSSGMLLSFLIADYHCRMFFGAGSASRKKRTQVDESKKALRQKTDGLVAFINDQASEPTSV